MQPLRTRRRSLRFLLPLGLLALGMVVMASGFDLQSLQAKLKDAGPWAPIAFVMVAILSMSAFVPKTIFSITAGALFGTLFGSGLMLISGVAAAALNYGIGRWWLFESINHRLNARTEESQFGSWALVAREMAADAGFGFHLMMRLLPVPTTVVSYVMGACGGRFVPFLLAATAAIIPQMLWIHSGSAIALIDDPDATGLRWMGVALSAIAAIAITVLVPRRALQRIEATRKTDSKQN